VSVQACGVVARAAFSVSIPEWFFFFGERLFDAVWSSKLAFGSSSARLTAPTQNGVRICLKTNQILTGLVSFSN
jgi:hypothetical protein